jgi:hypothetical protein
VQRLGLSTLGTPQFSDLILAEFKWILQVADAADKDKIRVNVLVGGQTTLPKQG